VKRRDLERHLREHGTRPLREGGRHSYWGFDPERSTAIPRHREIGWPLARKICKQLGIPRPPAHAESPSRPLVQPQFRAPLRALSSAWMLADLERARHPASSPSRQSRRGRDRCEGSGSRRGLHAARRPLRRGWECRKSLHTPGFGCDRARGRGGQNIFEQINTSTGTITYLHHDQAGSTRLLTGSTGTVTGKCTYGAYGTPSCEGTTTTPLGYDGQYTSSDTGLIYMRARVYDPATAQFLSVDQLNAITGEPYNYAGDNPVNEADPTGLWFGIELPSPTEAAEAVAGWGDKLTLGATKWAREQVGDENVNTCSAAYQAGGYAGLATAVLIPGEGEEELGVEGARIAESSAEHIFRDAAGHLAEDTPENRALIEGAVKSENYVRTGSGGESLYRETLPNGTQAWAKVFEGAITNGGVNDVPLP
jgi:RHS repeat-associated protein